MADIDQAIRLNSGNALAYNNRGKVKEAKGDLDGAIADFRRNQPQSEICSRLWEPGLYLLVSTGLRLGRCSEKSANFRRMNTEKPGCISSDLFTFRDHLDDHRLLFKIKAAFLTIAFGRIFGGFNVRS
jgi:hypothetical protein